MYGPGSLDQNMNRRSVYFFIKRSQLVSMMMLFDWPEHLVSIGSRPSTTIAPQALMIMNSPQGRRYAVALYDSLQGHSLDEQITQAYRVCYGRVPQPTELQIATQFLTQQADKYTPTAGPQAPHDALTDLCQALLASSEFVYRP